MKHSVFIILLSFISTSAPSQINKGKKLVTKGDYVAAIEAFENDLEKYTSKPISLHELAKIYFNKRYNGYDIEKAYQYISRAIKEYDGLNKSNRKKVQGKGLSKISMSKFQSDIVIEAFNITQKANNLDASKRFLEFYTTAGKQQTENMIKIRDRLAFEKATKENTFAAYKTFFKNYEISCARYNSSLLIKAQKKLLESYISEKGWKFYPTFEEKYRDNIYVKDAKAAYALIKIIRKNSLKEYQNYTEAFPHTPFNKFAKDYMFDIIMKGSNLPDYDYFVRAYPHYEKSDKIWLRFYRLYLQEHGSSSVMEFEKSYPNYPFQKAIQAATQEAQNKRDRPLFEEAKKKEDIFLILNFIEHCPSSPFVIELEKAMYSALKKRGLFRGCRKFLQLFPNSSYYDEVLDIYYDVYVSDGELETINQFMMEHPEYKDINKQEKDLKLAEQGSMLNLVGKLNKDELQAYEQYIRAAAPKERAFIALQRLIEQAIDDKQWSIALEKVKEFAPLFGANNTKIKTLQALLSSKDIAIRKMAMGGGINSSAPEYVPLISIDNQSLFFCRLEQSAAGLQNENIYVSSFKDQEWQMATPVKGLNTDTKNEGLLGISPDKQQIIIFEGNVRNGDMRISTRTSKGWSSPVPLPNTINTSSWDADGMISSDGNALLYVSERTDVLDLKQEGDIKGFHGSNTGNRDIFVSLKNEKGEWQEPINLGDAINTPFAERTPFLHPDMKTLYFSSDGHGGLGHLDVYKTTRLDDSWKNWSTPINLGKSINTTQNDWGYRVSTDGKTAYFATSNHDGDDDIYYVELPPIYQPEIVSVVSGKIIALDGQPIDAEIVWEEIETGKEMGRLKNNATSGDFFIALPNGKRYGYFIEKEGYFPRSNYIDLSNKSEKTTINDQLQLIKIDEMIDNHISLSINNLFFKNNQFELAPASYPALNRLAQIIKKDHLTTDILGYTDNQGIPKDQVELTQNRANAIKDYLISKGCKHHKITTKGLGSIHPIGDNQTPEGRILNNRIEVQFSR
ncbi:OmpA family protein [Aureispira anguillae]|uniref:OmpA family protein n=1 Tax=Aureispira anguillae TaxID=2864201 RepID=A0A915YM01_9BACT|nr:OmpA family protein [Aureispira anguillae]BDS15578.1 OmpA family protein [Aureispira anguillae]